MGRPCRPCSTPAERGLPLMGRPCRPCSGVLTEQERSARRGPCRPCPPGKNAQRQLTAAKRRLRKCRRPLRSTAGSPGSIWSSLHVHAHVHVVVPYYSSTVVLVLLRYDLLLLFVPSPLTTLRPLSPGSPAFLSPNARRFEAAARKDSGGRGEARACRARERDVGGTVGERAFSLSNPPILIPNTLAALAFAHRQRRPCSTDTWWALRVAGG